MSRDAWTCFKSKSNIYPCQRSSTVSKYESKQFENTLWRSHNPPKHKHFPKGVWQWNTPLTQKCFCQPEHAEIDKSFCVVQRHIYNKKPASLDCSVASIQMCILGCCVVLIFFFNPIPLNYNIVVKLMHVGTGDFLPKISSLLRYLFASLWLDGLPFTTAVWFSTATHNSDVSNPNIQTTDPCCVNCFAFFAEQVKIY